MEKSLVHMQLLLATSNSGKAREYKAMLKEIKGLDIYTLRDFPKYISPEETGTTFKENAELKASSAAKELNMLTLADDSGLVVPALNGEPGVISARYAHDQATEVENKNKLIKKLDSLPEEKRYGYFECVISIAAPTGVKKSVSGVCEGQLITVPRGRNGFGYDSLFLKYDYRRTFAELEEDTKNRISHRRKAMDKIMTTLHQLSTS